jgi:hypothetical protein
MNVNHDAVSGAKLAAISFASAMAGQVPAIQDLTDVGQIASIVVSIISGVVALVKLFKKSKS